jgi:hypothetical protein
MRLIPPSNSKPNLLAELAATIAGASLGLAVGTFLWLHTGDALWLILAPLFALAALGILNDRSSTWAIRH